MSDLGSIHSAILTTEQKPQIRNSDDLEGFLEQFRDGDGEIKPEKFVFIEPRESHRNILCIAETLNEFQTFLDKHSDESWFSEEELTSQKGENAENILKKVSNHLGENQNEC